MRYFLKFYLVVSTWYWTFLARVKIGCIGCVGKGFVAEGPIYLSAISGQINIGEGVRLGPHVRFGVSRGAKIVVGDFVSINQGTVLISVDSISIGRDSRIGEYCSIRDNDHGWKDSKTPVRCQDFVVGRVVVGEDVWLGRGVVIGKGVNVANKSVVGASSVVTKDTEEMSLSVGIPAKRIGYRTPNEG